MILEIKLSCLVEVPDTDSVYSVSEIENNFLCCNELWWRMTTPYIASSKTVNVRKVN